LTPRYLCVPLAVAGCMLSGCSKPQSPGGAAVPAKLVPKITQFYATAPRLAAGEKELLCYGVEGATSVHLEPPRQELSNALSRCVEVHPAGTTTYKLIAEGSGGPPATQELTVTVGAARAHIVNVDVSSLTFDGRTPVSICYKVQHASRVEIEPAHFRGGAKPEGCTLVTPKTATTYTVTAIGADGDRDQEHVTIKVK
jgi:hypothetical protein